MKQYLQYTEFQARPCWDLGRDLGIVSTTFEELDPEDDPPHFYTVYGTFRDGTQQAHFDLPTEDEARELTQALNGLLELHNAVRNASSGFIHIASAIAGERYDRASRHALSYRALMEVMLDAASR